MTWAHYRWLVGRGLVADPAITKELLEECGEPSLGGCRAVS